MQRQFDPHVLWDVQERAAGPAGRVECGKLVLVWIDDAAFEAALEQSTADGWAWVQLLTTFAVIYVAFGVLAFGSLLEES